MMWWRKKPHEHEWIVKSVSRGCSLCLNSGQLDTADFGASRGQIVACHNCAEEITVCRKCGEERP